jgi:hypothetical protein
MTDSKFRALLYINESLREQDLPSYNEVVSVLAALVREADQLPGSKELTPAAVIKHARDVLHVFNVGMAKS